MPRRIPVDISRVEDLAARVEYELSRGEQIARSGYISKSRLANPDSSYLFMEDGLLKYYDSEKGETKTVNLT